MSSFLQMKKARSASTNKLIENLKNAKGAGTSYKDERVYYPERDAQGNGYAIIRFLPTANEGSAEFVKVFSHGFKTPAGKWFIENCPTTLGHDCPVCEANSEIYNRSKEEYEATAKNRKRQTHFISNILVIKDQKHPENEGKVFLFKYGMKIFDMISAKANPPAEFGEEPVDIFSWDEGANFKLKIVIKDKQTNYDLSSFDATSAVADGDEDAQAKIFDAMHDLREFIDPKLFKDYDELKKKFDAAIGAKSSGRATRAEDVGEESSSDEGTAPATKPKEAAAPKQKEAKQKPPVEEEKDESSGEESEEQDPVEYFRRLASKS